MSSVTPALGGRSRFARELQDLIAFDLSALFVGAANDTPRGIDRVDIGWARRIFAPGESDRAGVLPSLGGMGILTTDETRKFLGDIERRWAEGGQGADDDAQTAWLRRRLAGEDPPRPSRRRGNRSALELVLRYGRLALDARRSPFRSAARKLPHGATYLNTGQVLLSFASQFDWLFDRRDVKPIFMMHDLIPIVFPEYCSPARALNHERSLDTVARHAAGLLATSAASADEIANALARRGRKNIPVRVVPLPVDEAFLAPRGAAPPYAAAAPYFVVVGSVEQRKNHSLLLNAWREISRAAPPPRPKLVILGAIGRRAEGILEFIQRSPRLARDVILVNGLSTPAMREVMRDARALLMPSFAEGFGLPIVEALALGTPVIASDIPAHREVGAGLATCLDPLDGPAWIAEIMWRVGETEAETNRRRIALAAFQPQTTTRYFEEALAFVRSL